MMKYVKIVMWIARNAPELFSFIKQIIDILDRAETSNAKMAMADIETTVKQPRKKMAGIHARIRVSPKL